jgi:hypothetical protein
MTVSKVRKLSVKGGYRHADYRVGGEASCPQVKRRVTALGLAG